MPIISDGNRIKVTVSVGISLVLEGDSDGHDAIERADKKNYLRRSLWEEIEFVPKRSVLKQPLPENSKVKSRHS